MKRIRLEKNKRALVIVAHPDDETIWMGGTVLRHKDVDWTIFSLCRFSDDDRRPKFRRVCKYYGAKSIITDLEDEDKLSVEETVPEIKKIIKNKIGISKFDYIFTHGANGDYGHPRHIGVNIAVREMIKDNKLHAERVFYFNYKKLNTKKASLMQLKANSDYYLSLTKQEFIEKKKIVAEMYGYTPDGIDVGLCMSKEGFIK